jgi:hypothetical protein
MVDDNSGTNEVANGGIEHAATYERFMGAMKAGVIAVAVLLILMALFLVR